MNMKENELSLIPKPVTTCKKCLGSRGYIGWDSHTGFPVLCTCITNRIGLAKDTFSNEEFQAWHTTNAKPEYKTTHHEPKSIRRSNKRAFKEYRKMTIREKKKKGGCK